MNFSSYRKYLFLSFIILSFGIGFSRCVPIEDLAKPLITDFELQTQYNISDSILLKAILRDNFGIQTVHIDIKSVENIPNAWSYTKTIDSIGARLLNLDEFKIIPSNTLLGEYELTLTIIDISGLEQSTSKTFIVDKDISTPTFTDVILPELDLIGDNLYQGCRSDLIRIAGTARDNVGLREIRAQFGTFPPIVRALSGEDSVDLSTAFGDALIIPTGVTNGTTLPLQLQATDTEGNVSRIDVISILVECDDAIPSVNLLITSPAVNTAGIIEVIQGQELFIIGGQVTDDEELDSLFISFVDGNTESSIIMEEINGISFNIASLGDIPVTIPTTAIVGSTYKIVVIATDISGNESVAYIGNILIIRNAPPQVLVANTYINNIETNFSSTALNPILAGATVRIEGKIEEDVALEYYRITWGVAGQEQTIVDLDQAALEGELPFNFTNPISENEFTTDENARVGTRYVLTLYVKDTLNAEVRIQYTFIIQ